MTELEWIDRRTELRLKRIEEAKRRCRAAHERKFEKPDFARSVKDRPSEPEIGAVARPRGKGGHISPSGSKDAHGDDFALGDWVVETP